MAEKESELQEKENELCKMKASRFNQEEIEKIECLLQEQKEDILQAFIEMSPLDNDAQILGLQAELDEEKENNQKLFFEKEILKNPMFKTSICYNMLNEGKCSYGFRCFYAHSSEELRETEACYPGRPPINQRTTLVVLTNFAIISYLKNCFKNL